MTKKEQEQTTDIIPVIEETKDIKSLIYVVRGQQVIRGINGTELVDLILKYYDDLDEKYQKMIPLKMVYIPVGAEN